MHVFFSARSSLGVSMAHHGCPSPCFNIKDPPKVAHKCQKEYRSTPQSNPEELQTIQKNSKSKSEKLARRPTRSERWCLFSYRSVLFPVLFPSWSPGQKQTENDAPRPLVRFDSKRHQYSERIGTHFGIKLHLVGFVVAGPAHCKMGGGRRPPRRGIQARLAMT